MLDERDQAELRVLAGRIANSSHLRDIRLSRTSSQLHSTPHPGSEFAAEMEVTLEPIVAGTAPDSALAVNASFDVSIRDADARTSVADVSCTFTASFTHDLGGQATEEELNAFANTTGIFAIYPYAREYISDATRRLGLPALVLDLLRL